MSFWVTELRCWPKKKKSVCVRVESYTSENSDLWRKVENLETANRWGSTETHTHTGHMFGLSSLKTARSRQRMFNDLWSDLLRDHYIWKQVNYDWATVLWAHDKALCCGLYILVFMLCVYQMFVAYSTCALIYTEKTESKLTSVWPSSICLLCYYNNMKPICYYPGVGV